MTKTKITQNPLFLPLICVLLVLAVNVVYDISQGSAFYDFFRISMQTSAAGNQLLSGRLITILNRGSEVAILAIGMTLVVSASAGTDISVGSVMSLCASFCCMLVAGFGVSAVNSSSEFAMPLVVGLLGALLMGCLCGAFNGTLVAYLNIQPMVATLILWSAARAIGLLLCNNLIVYIRTEEYAVFGGYIGFMPTPIIIAILCIAAVSLVLKYTAMGMYIQSVGINKRASRIAGLNSKRIIFMCYLLCGLCAGIAGIVNSSRITSADANNIGLNMELDAILAVALGGNSLGGGRFNLAGSIIGAYTIQAITTTMYNLGVSSAVTPVFKAVVVIVIVAIQAPPVKAWFRKQAAARKTGGKEAAHA
ncbi:ABC transporter permease [Oscillospiraceae bacterium 50-16]